MVTAAMKLKDHLLLGTKAMTNLDSILKSRDKRDIKNGLLDSLGEGGVGCFERIALKHVYYHK